MNQTQIFWNRSEKWLIAVCVIVVILGIAFIQWMRYLNQLPAVSVPTPTMPAPNAFDYFNKSGSLVRDSSKVGYAISKYHATPPYGPDDHPYSQAEKEKLVRENAGALTTLRHGFAYPYVNPPVRSFSTLLPYYTKYRQLKRREATGAEPSTVTLTLSILASWRHMAAGFSDASLASPARLSVGNQSGKITAT